MTARGVRLNEGQLYVIHHLNGRSNDHLTLLVLLQNLLRGQHEEHTIQASSLWCLQYSEGMCTTNRLTNVGSRACLDILNIHRYMFTNFCCGPICRLSAYYATLHIFNHKDMCLSAAYYPRTNGLVDRGNDVVCAPWTHYVSADQKDWDDWLPFIAFALNNALTKQLSVQLSIWTD